MTRSQTTPSPQLRVFALAATQFGLVTVGQVAARRMHPDTLRHWARTGQAERVRLGVYRLPGFPDCHEQRVMAAVLAGRPGTVASHATAARLYGLDGFDTSTEVHLLAPRGTRVPGVRLHQTDQVARVDRQTVNGIPATSPTRTLIDLAAGVHRDTLELAAEAAFRKRLTSHRLCLTRLDALTRPGVRGFPAMRAFLRQRGDVTPTESLAETRFVQLVRAGGFPQPERQYPVGPDGRRRLDFAWPLLMVGVEIDGAGTHAGAAALDHDLARQNAIILEGWLILRYSAARVMHTPSHPGILAELAAAHARAA